MGDWSPGKTIELVLIPCDAKGQKPDEDNAFALPEGDTVLGRNNGIPVEDKKLSEQEVEFGVDSKTGEVSVTRKVSKIRIIRAGKKIVPNKGVETAIKHGDLLGLLDGKHNFLVEVDYYDEEEDLGPGAVDLDGDGVADGFDLDGDGKIDALDLDGDGVIDAVDVDGDGKMDYVTINGETRDDVDLHDLDGDGKPDSYTIDAPDTPPKPSVASSSKSKKSTAASSTPKSTGSRRTSTASAMNSGSSSSRVGGKGRMNSTVSSNHTASSTTAQRNNTSLRSGSQPHASSGSSASRRASSITARSSTNRSPGRSPRSFAPSVIHEIPQANKSLEELEEAQRKIRELEDRLGQERSINEHAVSDMEQVRAQLMDESEEKEKELERLRGLVPAAHRYPAARIDKSASAVSLGSLADSSMSESAKVDRIKDILKKNRNLTVALERERSRGARVALELSDLKKKYDHLRAQHPKTKVRGIIGPVPDSPREGEAKPTHPTIDKLDPSSAQYLDKLRKLLGEANTRAHELRIANQNLKGELNRTRVVLQKEVGEDVDLTTVLSPQNDGTSWKGRAQTITLLKSKVKRMESALESHGFTSTASGNILPPNHSSGMHHGRSSRVGSFLGTSGTSGQHNSTMHGTGKKGMPAKAPMSAEDKFDPNIAIDATISKVTTARIQQEQQLKDDYDSLASQLADLKLKADATTARNRTLEMELRQMRSKVTVVLEKSDNDDALIDGLKKEVERLKKIVSGDESTATRLGVSSIKAQSGVSSSKAAKALFVRVGEQDAQIDRQEKIISGLQTELASLKASHSTLERRLEADGGSMSDDRLEAAGEEIARLTEVNAMLKRQLESTEVELDEYIDIQNQQEAEILKLREAFASSGQSAPSERAPRKQSVGARGKSASRNAGRSVPVAKPPSRMRGPGSAVRRR